MNKKYEKYLPIGSVVLLKNAKKRIMITGFCIKSKESDLDKAFDYIGCLYPEGIIDSEKNLLFDHNQIETIYAIGYSDDEEREFKKKLQEVLKEENNNV